MDAAQDVRTAVAAALRAGLAQDRATLAVLAEVLGEADPRRALALLAAEPDSSEHAPLTALLFSPGPELLRRLEPALAAADLDAAGAARLAKAVAADCAGTLPLRLPEGLPGGAPVPFPASAGDVRGLVRRLKAEATAPAELRAILARRFSPDVAADLAVRLRHSRLAWTPPQVFFLAALLERADTNGDDPPALVSWAAGFLDLCGLCGPEFSPREALTRRRQALEMQLRQAEAAEKALAGGSYEVRLSQGLRLGHVHAPDVRAELALLDRASRLVLGAPGNALAGVAVRDLGTAGNVEEWLGLLP